MTDDVPVVGDAYVIARGGSMPRMVRDWFADVSNEGAGSNSFNVRAYGAKGDVKKVATATIAAGSTTLTASGAGFSSADIGKVIIVEQMGAVRFTGATPNDVATTILAILSTDQVTLGVAATTAVANLEVMWGTDDTAAFNDCSAALRAAEQRNMGNFFYYADRTLTVPPGQYFVSSWDLTSIQGRNTHIMAYGACLIGIEADFPVVDYLGARWVHTHGLFVMSNNGPHPSCGVLIGAYNNAGVSPSANGNMQFDDVKVFGYFALTALYNAGAETTAHRSCDYVNIYAEDTVAVAPVDRNTYGVIADGATQFIPRSKYKGDPLNNYLVPRTLGRLRSFTTNAYYGCQMSNQGTGHAMFLANAKAHSIDKGCYLLSFDAAAIVMYQTGSCRNQTFSCEALIENALNNRVPGGMGLRWMFLIKGNGSSASAINMFSWRSGGPPVHESVFKIHKPSFPAAMSITQAHISCPSLFTGDDQEGSIEAPLYDGFPCWFSDCELLSIDGEIMLDIVIKGADYPDKYDQFNVQDIASFDGILRVSDIDYLQGMPVAGAYSMYSANDHKLRVVGDTTLGAMSGDQDYTLEVLKSGNFQRHLGVLTAPRTVTLSADSAANGDWFTITRTGGGDFDVDVGPGLYFLKTNTWCTVVRTGGGWVLIQTGLMDASADPNKKGFGGHTVDESYTIVVGTNQMDHRNSAVLTADRTVTITGGVFGARYRIFRTGANAPGITPPPNLIVAGGVAVLGPGEWAEVFWSTGSWVLCQSGTNVDEDPNLNGSTTVTSNADYTLTVGTSTVTHINAGTFTGNHVITLAGNVAGGRFRVARTGGSTGGPWTLSVGGVKTLSTGQWCDVALSGGVWVCTGFGSL